MKKSASLLVYFEPEAYFFDKTSGELVIKGNKLGRPSKRIVLHQKGLKIERAEIVRHDKKGDLQKEVCRINHLPTFEQVRLHTSEMLSPGSYTIKLMYQLPQKSNPAKPGRTWLPSVDEPEAWAKAKVEIR